MTSSTTSGWRSAAKELRLSIGTPSRTAMRAIATSSARRVRDCSWATRLNTLAVKAAVGLGETCEIVVNVPAQALGEVVPGGLGQHLEGRLGEPPQRPAIDCSRTGIPRPCHKAPRGIVRCPCGRLGAVAPVLIKDRVVDRRWADRPGRAVAHQTVEPVPYAAFLSRHRTSPTRATAAPLAAARRAPCRTSAAPPGRWTCGSPRSSP